VSPSSSGRPYTETFVRALAAGIWNDYQVPAGKRAVVSSVVVANVGGAVVPSTVVVGGAYVYSRAPAADSTDCLQMRVVAYSGEYISGQAGAAGHQVVVSGYLFDDSSGQQRPADELRLGETAVPRPSPQ